MPNISISFNLYIPALPSIIPWYIPHDPSQASCPCFGRTRQAWEHPGVLRQTRPQWSPGMVTSYRSPKVWRSWEQDSFPKTCFLWMPGAKRSLAAKQNIQKHPKSSKIIQNSVILGAARRSSDRNYMESSVRHHLFESSSHVISNGRCLVLSIWKLRLLFLQLAIHLLAAPQRKQRWSRTCENQCLSRQFKDIFINLHVEKNYR